LSTAVCCVRCGVYGCHYCTFLLPVML